MIGINNTVIKLIFILNIKKYLLYLSIILKYSL